ncbi:MAG: hypothetical protein ACTSUR_06295 [Candidatus Heimdallarchaeaceae archaeon]
MLSEHLYPITFLKTNDLSSTRYFYEKVMKFPIALEQSNCIIFSIGKYGYWGFCQTDTIIEKAEQICLTVVVRTRKEVDNWYNFLISRNIKSSKAPEYNSKYQIYNCFFTEPNGYVLEIQAFSEGRIPEGHNEMM